MEAREAGRDDPAWLNLVSSLKKRLRFNRWHQPEDLRKWRNRIVQAWDKCSAGLEGWSEELKDEEDAIDISAEGVRLPTQGEDVELMLRRKLVADGLLPEGSDQGLPEPLRGGATAAQGDATGQAEGSCLDESDKTAARALVICNAQEGSSGADAALQRRRNRRPRARKRRIDLDEDVEDEEPAKKSACSRAETVASIAEVVESRQRKTQSTTSKLVRKHVSVRSVECANKSAAFTAHPSIANAEPHKWWKQKLAVAGLEVDGQQGISNSTEIILTVAVCNSAGAKEQEYDVLASQHLYELRDAFHFASDWMYDGPTRLNSACFFIDGIFYVDKRDPTALDYSVEIVDWVKATRPGLLRSHESKSMDLRFIDLEKIPFGEKCLYIHQGDLEHAVIFTNARLMHTEHDCPCRVAYPVLTFMRRYTKRRCYACLENLAIWVVIDSSRCPYNPSFWCQNCFRHFFQDAEGEYLQPIDYKVFPYLHDDL